MRKTIKIGTFNLYNLVLPNTIYYGNRKYSLTQYNQKIEWISEQLQKMHTQIVGFQEVFHVEALKEALRESKLFDKVNLVSTPEQGDRPIVALASKFPIKNFSVIDNFPENSKISLSINEDNKLFALPYDHFSRPILRAIVNIHGVDFVIYVVHLKSKRPIFIEGESHENAIDSAKGETRSLILRATEATALRSILLNDLKDKNRPLILLGDVNDIDLSVTTKIISGEAPHRKYPQEVKEKIWDTLLYHVKDIQARKSFGDFYYTHIHNGHYQSLDQIMVSQELVAENPRNIGRIGYVSLFNDHLIDETLTNEKVQAWQSDHGQVVASLELRIKNN